MHGCFSCDHSLISFANDWILVSVLSDSDRRLSRFTATLVPCHLAPYTCADEPPPTTRMSTSSASEIGMMLCLVLRTSATTERWNGVGDGSNGSPLFRFDWTGYAVRDPSRSLYSSSWLCRVAQMAIGTDAITIATIRGTNTDKTHETLMERSVEQRNNMMSDSTNTEMKEEQTVNVATARMSSRKGVSIYQVLELVHGPQVRLAQTNVAVLVGLGAVDIGSKRHPINAKRLVGKNRFQEACACDVSCAEMCSHTC